MAYMNRNDAEFESRMQGHCLRLAAELVTLAKQANRTTQLVNELLEEILVEQRKKAT